MARSRAVRLVGWLRHNLVQRSTSRHRRHGHDPGLRLHVERRHGRVQEAGRRRLSAILVRTCRIAALLGGLVWVVDGLVRQTGAAYWNPRTLADYSAMASYSVGLLAFVAVFVGLRASPRWHAGLPGTIAVVVAVFGAVLGALGNFIEDGLHVAVAA